MGDIVDLPRKLPSKDDYEFVVDLARFAEGITTEAEVKKKYRLGDDVWEQLGNDDELVRAITDEKTRRIRNGSHKREKAQLLVVKAPDVLSGILLDNTASPRHRIDSAKTLNDFAANPSENSPAAAGYFQISINLGADVDGKPIIEHYSKSIAIDPNDGDPNGKFAPQGSLPDKRWDSDDDDTVATPVKRPVKTIKHEAGKVVERKSPEEMALEAFMALE